MGLYIHGMSMPKDENDFVKLVIFNDGRCFVAVGENEVTSKTGVVTARELPPHGRTIDADKVRKSVQAQTEIVRKWGIDELTEIADLLEKGFLQEVENAETIIPADGGEKV